MFRVKLPNRLGNLEYYHSIIRQDFEQMSSLSFNEKRLFEKLFGMSSGYVLDFSDTTFQDFIADAVGKDIYEKQYDFRSGSKANRLRKFWEVENNNTVGVLLDKLLNYRNLLVEPNQVSSEEVQSNTLDECIAIIEKLKSDAIVNDLGVLKPNNSERDFLILAESVKDSIERNEPEAGLDRLHTFVTKFVRELCLKHNIPYENGTTLDALVGKYTNYLRGKGIVESEMSIEILKASIRILEKFNFVRNNQSLAHANKLLNYNESVYIFNNIVNLIKFLEELEKNSSKKESGDVLEDLPF